MPTNMCNSGPMIKLLLSMVSPKYCDLSVSRRSINYLRGLWLRQIIDLLAVDKSQYFAQPCPIIINYFGGQLRCNGAMHVNLHLDLNI